MSVTHQCPEGDSNRMPCCGIPPGERAADRMTLDPALVTCRPSPDHRCPEECQHLTGQAWHNLHSFGSG